MIMQFVQIFTWIIIVYGITTIIVESRLFKPLRNSLNNTFIGHLITCVICTSVWVGFICSFYYSPTSIIFSSTSKLNIFFDGMFASVWIWWLHLFENILTKIIK